MRLRPFLYSILFAIACILSSCKKEQIPLPLNTKASVYIIHKYYDDNIDSLNFSFVSLDTAIRMDTVWIPVRISGDAANYDRTINLVADPSTTTAVAGKHYKLLNFIMPKDSFSTNLGVVLIRTPDLQDTSVILNLQIRPSPDFPVVMKDTLMADGNHYNLSSYKITFTDELIKPSNWDSFLVYIFGSYSQVKYRFIINTLGVADFPTSGPNAIAIGELFYYQSAMEDAIAEYNTLHGTMYDENGNPVTFP